MIEDIPLDTFDDDREEEDDGLLNTGFSADDEQTYDSVTPGSKIDRQRRDLVRGKIKDLERKFNTSIPPTEYDRFRLSGKELQFKKSDGQYVSLTNTRSGKFLESSGIRNRLGAGLARDLLNIETPPREKAKAKKLLDTIPTEIEMDELTPEHQIKAISVATNTELDMREFLGIDKALTRIKGELQNNASKLSKIDEHLKKEYDKLKEVQHDEKYKDLQKKIKNRIKDLKEERATRLEILSQNRKELASQFSRMRQTAEKILDGDLSLKEKIKLVFREHGITITAVLTSVGLLISTIITALTGGGGGGSKTPPKNPNKLKEWVKAKLKALARLLGRLAGKAAAALPGIIGSIIAGVLNFLKKVVTAASEHVWLFLTSITTLMGYRLFLYISPAAVKRKAEPSPLGAPHSKKR